MKFLLVVGALLASGCAEQAQQSFAENEQYPIRPYPYPESFKKSTNENTTRLKSTKQGFNKNDLIWDRLISLYALPEINDPRVEQELNWYLDHPDYIARVQKRAEPYLYQIVNEIEAQQIPGEMALLPIVESAFQPEAVSSAAAAGLWQFMPATGKLFGLEQNRWYDGRRDIYRSTQAAASYLKDLSETFGGDWLLALASYNYGKGNIQKAIDRNLINGEPTDYWSLRGLPQETRAYVPKLLAIAKLFAHADEYNIPLHPIRNRPVFEVVEIGSAMNLEQAAAMANTDTEQFLKLNPGYKNNVTAPDGPTHLLIPAEQVSSFKEKLDQIPEEEKALLGQRLKEEQLQLAAAKRAEEVARRARIEENARRARAEEVARRAEEIARKAAVQEMLARKAAEERFAQQRAAAIKLAEAKEARHRQEEIKRLNAKKPGKLIDPPIENIVVAKKGNSASKATNNAAKSAQKPASTHTVIANNKAAATHKVAQPTHAASNSKAKAQLVASNTNKKKG